MSEVDSYEDGDMWAKKFEEAFFEYMNENNQELKENKMLSSFGIE